MSSSLASRFDSMPAQPPTPPKGVSNAVDDAISLLDDSHEIDRAVSKSLVERRPRFQAVVPSPAPSQESAATSASLSKRVGFSPHAIFHELPDHDRFRSPAGRSLKRSPSTKASKPLKSILKSTHCSPLTPEDLESKLGFFSPDVPGSFAKMLQSIINQLGGQSVSNRLDAYIALNTSLQAYSDVPDLAALVQKLGIITQFLSRDIAWKGEDGKLNTNIAVQALKLTNFLLFNDAVSAALDADFRCFLIDRSIAVLQSSEFPKQVMKAHIHLLALPQLQYPAMTASRADKVLGAVQTVDQRCSGNNTIAARLVIYQRLLEQAPTLMLTRVRDWLEQVFHCMLSSISDIRGRAIDTCTKGGVRLGTQTLATKAMSEFLETEIEGQSYFVYFSTKLLEMLVDKELGPCVPRIWSAIILYFRNKRKPLEKWTGFKNWLTIIQKCLNSSEIAVRYEATLAWNKLVYTTLFDASPSPGLMRMLKTPVLSGMDRRGNDSFSKQIRQYTMDCYCNLLHYGLRPSLPADELEAGWKAFVDPILLPMAKGSQKGRTTACRILYGLMSGNNGVWNSNAALMPIPVKPEDLPRLEPRWIRSHLASILGILQPVVHAALWLGPESSLSVEATWAALMQTLSDAGAQEVKTSNDLKQAIALLVSFFCQLWSSSAEASAEGDPDRWLSNYVSLIGTTVRRLGSWHFIEDYLTTANGDVVEVAPTPSTKRSKRHSAPQSPMMIILRRFFASTDSGFDSRTSYWSTVGALLDRFMASRSSPLRTVELLSRTFFTLQSTSTDETESHDNEHLWEAFAKSTIAALGSPALTEQQQPGHLGQTLRYAVDMLSAGLAFGADADSALLALLLYDAIQNMAKEGSGDAGVVIAVMEPVAKAIFGARPSLSFERIQCLAAHIVTGVVWPKNRQSIDNARKALWGPGLAPQKATLFDPFEQVYALLVDAMTCGYVHYDPDSAQGLSTNQQLLSAALSFLEGAPLSLLLTAFRRTQEGFAVWIQDKERKTGTQEEVPLQIMTTWTTLLKLMKSIPSSDSKVIKALEPLLVAGFASPHRHITYETIVFWNAKFGGQQTLEYPSKLESVLRARTADADIELPTFPDSNVDHVPATLPDFFVTDSQEPKTTSAPGQIRLRTATGNLQPVQSAYFTAQNSPPAKATTVPNTIDRRSAVSRSSTPRARLRHDDSQVQFASIDSSPLRFRDDSQHLTEHQKEVLARQNEAARMFPEMSSSPMDQSTALPRPFSKRLDFSSEAHNAGEDDLGTPTALADTGLMSDDLPSSPTPSSTKDADSAPLDSDDEQATEDELPSSPPRGQESQYVPSTHAPQHDVVGPDESTVGFTDFALSNNDAVTELPVGAEVKPAEDNDDANEEPADQNELPSDSILPAEQLQLEAQAAEVEDETSKSKSGVDRPACVAATEEAGDVTRVEDSFIGAAQDNIVDNEDAAETPNSRRSTRKRKRSASVTSSAKKRKSASPLKQFWSRIWPSSQQDDDEGIGEEIVVASSQRSLSPDSPRPSQPEPSQSREEPAPEAFGEATEAEQIKQEVMAPPPKRRPGRPRNSATPTPSLSSQTNEEPAQTRSLKRKSSALSAASASETEASSSFVKDTPAPTKIRKGRKWQIASQSSQASSPQQNCCTSRVTRRTATAVLISPPCADAEAEVEPAGNEDEVEEQETAADASVLEKQAQTTASTAVAIEQRPKLTPRSILGRLRDVLSDFVGMKVNATEAREFDDVLYEFRREAFDAERRGRDDGGH